MNLAFDSLVDARGLNCPWPVLRLRNALERLQEGKVVKVMSTEAQVEKDFRTFCSRTGNEFVGAKAGRTHIEIFVRKA